MPLKLIAPIIKEFVLERSDKVYGNPEEPTMIGVRQATQEQNILRSQLFDKWRQTTDPETGMEQVIQTFNYALVMRKETFLTLCRCDITDADDSPLFKFRDGRLAMSESDFNRAWGKLPLVVCQEIHEKVLEVNPDWGGGALGEAA